MAKYLDLGEYIQKLKKNLAKQFSCSFPESKIKEEDIALEKTPSPELGQFAVACFSFARALKKNPQEVAATVAKDFPEDRYIRALEAVGPYVNVHLHAADFLLPVCRTILAEGKDYGRNELGKGKTVMIEYSSPNTNKPLHIGHVRNNLIGMALANILEFSSYHVVKANLINDRGIHICKSMLAYQKCGENKTPEVVGKKGDHFVGEFYVRFEEEFKKERKLYAQSCEIDIEKFSQTKQLREEVKSADSKEKKQLARENLRRLEEESEKFEQRFLSDSQNYREAMDMLLSWEQGDKATRELWERMREWVLQGFEETYRHLGCSFDKMYFESDTYMLGKEYVDEGLQKEVFYRKEDGSVWCSSDKMKQIAPDVFKGAAVKDKLLLRSDGTSVYITQDIGTAVLKQRDFDLDESIYVVAEEQNLHFKILFAVLELLGFDWAKRCRHLAYGMVTLPRGLGKIKSREGTAVDADDMIADMIDRAKQKIEHGEVHVPPEKIEETAFDIALAALKIFILQVSLDKNIQFDPEKTIEFTGDTGPAVQYSYARIRSMSRKAQEEFGVVVDGLENRVDYSLLNSLEEIELARQLSEFPDVIATVAQKHQINLLTAYLLSLTKSYARLYQLYPVLKASDELRAARLVLAEATAQVIANGMTLLGATVPESM